MWAILKEMTAYAMFIWILLVLSYGNRDPNSYFLRNALTQSLARPGDVNIDFSSIRNASRFYLWAQRALVQQLAIGENYNGERARGKERKLMQDRVSLLLGYAVLRQVRVTERKYEAQ